MFAYRAALPPVGPALRTEVGAGAGARFVLAGWAVRFVQTRAGNFMAAITICSDFGAQKNKV